MTEDEIVGQHHRLNGHEFGQVLRDGGGQGSLACCSSWGHQESDMTEQQKNNQKELSGISGNNTQLWMCLMVKVKPNGTMLHRNLVY